MRNEHHITVSYVNGTIPVTGIFNKSFQDDDIRAVL